MPGNRLWTDEELGVLAAFPEWTPTQLGRLLERTADAVRAKRKQIEDGWAGTRHPWTPEDIDFIRVTPHLTAREVAEQLGLTISSVTNRRHILAHTEGIDFGTSGKRGAPSSDGPKVRVGSRRLIARTCEQCGLLLDASWFHRIHKPHERYEWGTQCSRCRGRAVRQSDAFAKRAEDRRAKARARRQPNYQKLQALTIPHASRSGFPWLDSDHDVLRDPELLVVEKALRLGRTYAATTTACNRFGYQSKVGRGNPMLGRWVIHNPNIPARDSAA